MTGVGLLGHGERRPFEDPLPGWDTAAEAELREKVRQLRLVCDLQRRELLRVELERDRLRARVEYLEREMQRRPWWKRW